MNENLVEGDNVTKSPKINANFSKSDFLYKKYYMKSKINGINSFARTAMNKFERRDIHTYVRL